MDFWLWMLAIAGAICFRHVRKWVPRQSAARTRNYTLVVPAKAGTIIPVIYFRSEAVDQRANNWRRGVWVPGPVRSALGRDDNERPQPLHARQHPPYGPSSARQNAIKPNRRRENAGCGGNLVRQVL